MKKIVYTVFALSMLISCVEEEERLAFMDDPANRIDTYYEFENDTIIVVEGSSNIFRLETPLKTKNDHVVLELSATGDNVQDILPLLEFRNVTELGDGPEGNINELEINGSTLTAVIHNHDTLSSLPIDIEVVVEDNDQPGETQYLTLNLDRAYFVDSETEINVGDIEGNGNTLVLEIADDDCESDIAGSYMSVNCYPDPEKEVSWTEDVHVNGRYEVSDITGGYYAPSGLSEISAVLIDKCGNLSIEEPAVVRYSNGEPAISIVASGKVNADGSITLEWTDELGFYTNGDPTECSTVFTPL